MDLFGLQEHEDRHDEVERQLRRLVEQVAQLSIDLGVTRTELRALGAQVDGKVDEDAIDPVLIALNEGISTARQRLEEAQAATESEWNDLSDQLTAALDEMRAEINDADASSTDGAGGPG